MFFCSFLLIVKLLSFKSFNISVAGMHKYDIEWPNMHRELLEWKIETGECQTKSNIKHKQILLVEYRMVLTIFHQKLPINKKK